MSCGSFAIVFSCVVVCEMRDKVLEMMDEREKILGAHQKLKPNIKLDFFQSVVYPQHNRKRPGQRPSTHNTSGGTGTDPFPSCEVGASGSGGAAGPPIQMTELRPNDGQSPATASSTRVSSGRIDAAGTPRASFCAVQVAVGSRGGSTSDRLSGRPSLASETSVDESELRPAPGCTAAAARKRVRYSSEPFLLLHHGRHGRPSAGIRWSPAFQGATAVLLKADGRGWPPEERRREGSTGRLLIARVQVDAGQRPPPPPPRIATKRLLVSRKPVTSGGRGGTGCHTTSVEVLVGRDEIRHLHDTNRDAAVCPDAALSAMGTNSVGTLTTGLGQSFPLPRPTQVRLKAHMADAPPNVLVHQAYVHAEPDRGAPVTAILPQSTTKSDLGTTLQPRMASPPGIASLPVMASSPVLTPLQGAASPPGVMSPPGVTSRSFMTSLPRMTTACPRRSWVPPPSHRLSLPTADSDSDFAFSSMQISPSKYSSRRALKDQMLLQQQQPLHEHHRSQKMRVEASGTLSIKDLC